MKDRYECYYEARQRVASKYAYQYAGASAGKVMPSCSEFSACLAARGYSQALDTTDISDFYQPGNFYLPASAVIHCLPD